MTYDQAFTLAVCATSAALALLFLSIYLGISKSSIEKTLIERQALLDRVQKWLMESVGRAEKKGLVPECQKQIITECIHMMAERYSEAIAMKHVAIDANEMVETVRRTLMEITGPRTIGTLDTQARSAVSITKELTKKTEKLEKERDRAFKACQTLLTALGPDFFGNVALAIETLYQDEPEKVAEVWEQAGVTLNVWQPEKPGQRMPEKWTTNWYTDVIRVCQYCGSSPARRHPVILNNVGPFCPGCAEDLSRMEDELDKVSRRFREKYGTIPPEFERRSKKMQMLG